MPRWPKVLVEMYDENGYQGHWEVTPPAQGEGFDPPDVVRIVQQIRGDKRYEQSHLHFCEDGGDCIIGVFNGWQPTGESERGTHLPPQLFDAS